MGLPRKESDFLFPGSRKSAIHEGVVVRALEKKGVISNRCEINRQIKADNSLLRELKVEVKKLMRSERGNKNTLYPGTLTPEATGTVITLCLKYILYLTITSTTLE